MTTPTRPARPARLGRHSGSAPSAAAETSWAGRTRDYDLVKEFVIAVVAVAVLTAGLAALFSSPDEQQVTLSKWSTTAPNDFLQTAATELDGTSGTATYGAPYTHTPDAAQKIGPVSLQHIAGVTHPIDAARDFVLRPLYSVPGDAPLRLSLRTWTTATAASQQQWATAYDDALAKVDGEASKVTPGPYGPVPVMLDRLLVMAQSGGLDGVLLSQGAFFATDYTKPLLFIADGSYLEDRARAEHLGGDQWGMMNETANYPGQAWLWLYTFWYQVEPFKSSPNADALVWGLMALLSLGLVLVPWIPGVRSIPRWVPVHRLIWRDYYRSAPR